MFYGHGNLPTWFVGKDVAEALGYNDTADAIKKHIFLEDKGVGVLPTPGGLQKMTIINESGLYSLIFSSKLESAKKFKKWVLVFLLAAAVRQNKKIILFDVAKCTNSYYNTHEKFVQHFLK